MEKTSLKSIRKLIIDSHSVGDDGVISFDISKAMGYTDMEMDTANKILAMERVDYLDELFKSKIIFASFYPASEPSLNVLYIAFAKLIFVVNKEQETYTYITEEDLEEKVADTQNFMIQLVYVMANSNNDAYGNPV